jgi:hypothetical protein
MRLQITKVIMGAYLLVTKLTTDNIVKFYLFDTLQLTKCFYRYFLHQDLSKRRWDSTD